MNGRASLLAGMLSRTFLVRRPPQQQRLQMRFTDQPADGAQSSGPGKAARRRRERTKRSGRERDLKEARGAMDSIRGAANRHRERKLTREYL